MSKHSVFMSKHSVFLSNTLVFMSYKNKSGNPLLLRTSARFLLGARWDSNP